MPQKSLNVEIAGLCAEIFAEDSKVFAYLGSRFRNFLSESEPDFDIDLREKPKSLNIGVELLNELANMPQATTLIQKNHRYSFVAKTDSTKEIGFIDVERKRCLLYELFKDSRALLFTDFLLFCLYVFLGSSNGFLLHACGVVKDNEGYVFAGPSESGKTTVARLSKGLTLLSDECLCIKESDNSYRVYGTPWGKGGNKFAKIKNVFFLKKGKAMAFKRVKPAAAASRILRDASFGALGQQITRNILNSVAKMVDEVPCYEMRFSVNSPIWESISDLY